jgi:hypothetical protein
MQSCNKLRFLCYFKVRTASEGCCANRSIISSLVTLSNLDERLIPGSIKVRAFETNLTAEVSQVFPGRAIRLGDSRASSPSLVIGLDVFGTGYTFFSALQV